MQDFTLNKGKLAIILAGLFCLYAVYGAVNDFKLPGEAQALEPADPIVELDPVNVQLLTKTHLFGQPPQVKVAVKQKTVNKPNNSKAANNAARKNQQAANKPKPAQKPKPKPIKINVTVTGLLASADEDYAAAVLKVDNKPEKLYKVGEDLGKPEVKLQSVELESVVIDNNGNEQTIAMKRPGLESSGKPGNVQRTNRSNNNQSANQIPQLPPELELPEELEYLNAIAPEGAFVPPQPEPVNVEQPPLPEEIEEQMLLEQMQDELDQDIQAELGLNNNAQNSRQIPPQPELEGEAAASPNFKMPVF